jgi:hypothetical protein
MLQWIVVGAQDQTVLWQRNLSHPTLILGTTWSSRVEWPIPTEDYVVTLKIIRLTGLTALERTYDTQGDQRQSPTGQPSRKAWVTQGNGSTRCMVCPAQLGRLVWC